MYWFLKYGMHLKIIEIKEKSVLILVDINWILAYTLDIYNNF